MYNFIFCAVVHCGNARLLFMKDGLKLPNTDNLLALFITFEWGRILENAMDRKWNVVQNYVVMLFLWTFLY